VDAPSLPAELQPEHLLRAYASGWFPMDEAKDTIGPVSWYDPDPRAILPLDAVRPSRTLLRILRQGRFELRIDTACEQVIRACARPRFAGDGVWISDRFVRAYLRMHELGYVHSLEAWRDDVLAGGLYGVALGRAFMAESMFHHEPHAGSVALVAGAWHLRRLGFELFDVQFSSPHLERLGVVEVLRHDYRRLLARALRPPDADE
jgi:leucyl/phenylalanyl-tRNA--protein transferase